MSARSRAFAEIGWSSGSALRHHREIGRLRVEIVGDPPVAPRRSPVGRLPGREPGYFDTLDLPIIAGRDVHRSRHVRPPAGVCIVNEAFVRRYLGGRDPLGMRLATAGVPGLFPAHRARDRRRRPTAEGPSRRARTACPDLRAAGAVSVDRHLPGRASVRGTRAGAARTHSRGRLRASIATCRSDATAR